MEGSSRTLREEKIRPDIMLQRYVQTDFISGKINTFLYNCPYFGLGSVEAT